MALSLGSGLTQELLLLVWEDCVDSLSLQFSYHSSSSCPTQTASSLLFCSKLTPPLPPPPPRISSNFHLFVASVSTDSVNQTEDGQTTAPSVEKGLGQSRRGYYNTHTHTASPFCPFLLFMYLSLRFTGWLDFITSTIIILQKVSDRENQRQRERERERERDRSGGGVGNYIIFLSEYISLNCVTA